MTCYQMIGGYKLTTPGDVVFGIRLYIVLINKLVSLGKFNEIK